MDISLAPPSSRGKTILVAATGWGPSFGGINAFSFDFCLALGRLFKGTARVICLTTPVDEVTKAAAAEQGVEIIALRAVGPADPTGTAVAARDLLRGEGIEQVDLLFGHDVFTGPVVIALRSLLGGVAAVIHHMSYGSYQAVKAHGQTARQKEEEQRQLLGKADVVLAVGPLLKRSAESLCQRPVKMIVPGLAEIEPVQYREGYFRAIAFGRLGGADDRIKLGSLAAAGYGRFVKLASRLNLYQEYRFNVFGLSAEEYAAEEKALCSAVNAEAGRLVNVVACKYTEKRSELFTALSHNEVATMLSWHEGFGLVGWEAIAACVPLIVSQATGLYALLRDDAATFGADCVNLVDVRGSATDTPNEEDVVAIADSLLRIATKFPSAMKRAVKLRDHLRTLYSWDGCARAALEACGWGSPLPPKPGHGRGEAFAPVSQYAPLPDWFVPRDWVVEQFEEFMKRNRRGYFPVVADAGLGKTILARDVARRFHAVAHYFNQAEGRTTGFTHHNRIFWKSGRTLRLRLVQYSRVGVKDGQFDFLG